MSLSESGPAEGPQIWSREYDVWFVSVQGVKSLGGHFACLCRGFDFHEVKKNYYYFSKRKWKYFYTLIIFIVKKSKIAQIYYYEPQSAGINLWSPQSESTPRRLKISWTLLYFLRANFFPSKALKIRCTLIMHQYLVTLHWLSKPFGGARI